MPNNLTDKEIKKALRSWLEEIRKYRQAYLEKVNEEHYPSVRYEFLLSDTIHEINRLQAENERLETKNKHYAELEQGCYVTGVKNIKAEAYKEFAERLKEKTISFASVIAQRKVIDSLLNELVGEDK